ncbi:MAG: conjugal transfer protein TraX [Candidatus Kerfeldbacteria bacterium]|nr:conjugal transfer protein TraX [Candidatus Kerfeldbacteria bacterium]
MKKFNAFQLKIIAVVLMVVDHVAEFAQPALSETAYYAMRYAGRLVFPIFLFLLVESFFNTSHQGRYVQRLWIWALGMMAGSYALIRLCDSLLGRTDAFYAQGYVEFDRLFYGVGNNIFLSLACIATVLVCVTAWKNTQSKSRWRIFCTLAPLLVAFFVVEGRYPGLYMALAFFIWHGKPVRQYFAFACVVAITALIHVGLGENMFVADGYNWMMVFALPLIMMYNGERGPHTKSAKYFFYIFYPAHLWILYIIARVALWR